MSALFFLLYLLTGTFATIERNSAYGVASGLLLLAWSAILFWSRVKREFLSAAILSLPIAFGALYGFSWVVIFWINRDLIALAPLAPDSDEAVYQVLQASYTFFSIFTIAYVGIVFSIRSTASRQIAQLSHPVLTLLKTNEDLAKLLFLAAIANFLFIIYLRSIDIWSPLELGDRGRVWEVLSESRVWIFHVVLVTLSYLLLAACNSRHLSFKLRFVGAGLIVAYMGVSLVTGNRREILPLAILFLLGQYQLSRKRFLSISIVVLAGFLSVGFLRLGISFQDASVETILSGLFGELVFSRVPLFSVLSGDFAPNHMLWTSPLSALPIIQRLFPRSLADQLGVELGKGYSFSFTPDAEALLAWPYDFNVLLYPLFLLPFLVTFLLSRNIFPLLYVMLAFGFWRGELASTISALVLHLLVFAGFAIMMKTRQKRNST